MSTEAFAGGRNPGSLLLYPEFDNRAGTVTVLTVTNTNDDISPAAGNPLAQAGTVRVEFKYIGKYDNDYNEINCEEFNREAVLTPNDTLTLITNAHNPQHEQGYVYVFAKDMSGASTVHNYLIGNILTVDGFSSFEYSVNPIAFDGVGDEGSATDVDGDGHHDLDGVEYSEAADEILIPRFLGQGGYYQSELILVALSGGSAFSTTLDFLIYNDNEEVFSSEYTFDCWDQVHLLEISGIFDNEFLASFTNQNPAEVLGAPEVESGWMRIDGGIANSTVQSINDPAFAAVLVERISDKGASDLPFENGSQDNGDLLPRSIHGDS
jgi:hypothetical protein